MPPCPACVTGGMGRGKFMKGLSGVLGLVGTAAPTPWFGLAQRAFLLIIVIWSIVLANWLRAEPDHAAA